MFSPIIAEYRQQECFPVFPKTQGMRKCINLRSVIGPLEQIYDTRIAFRWLEHYIPEVGEKLQHVAGTQATHKCKINVVTYTKNVDNRN